MRGRSGWVALKLALFALALLVPASLVAFDPSPRSSCQGKTLLITVTTRPLPAAGATVRFFPPGLTVSDIHNDAQGFLLFTLTVDSNATPGTYGALYTRGAEAIGNPDAFTVLDCKPPPPPPPVAPPPPPPVAPPPPPPPPVAPPPPPPPVAPPPPPPVAPPPPPPPVAPPPPPPPVAPPPPPGPVVPPPPPPPTGSVPVPPAWPPISFPLPPPDIYGGPRYPVVPECKVSYKIEGGPGISIHDYTGALAPATSTRNEPIPLYVLATDMDQLLQTCACFVGEKEVSSTHKYINVPDTIEYRWKQVEGKGTLAAMAGPATLYQPPPLPWDATKPVRESDTAVIEAQMVDARDNDKAAYVRFAITVTRVEECKYQRTFDATKQSDPGSTKDITDIHTALECNPQDKTWEKEPAPITGNAPAEVKVCVGERTLLTASASDTDTLKLKCQGPCGSAKEEPKLDDPVGYIWEAAKGGFPDYGGRAVTNSNATSIIYMAPPTPEKKVPVHVHIGDSGEEAADKIVSKVIHVTAYKLDLQVAGKKDGREKGCDAYFLCLNDDDDDEKGVDDRRPEPEKVASERDRRKITLKMEPEKSGKVTLDASEGKERIRVWTAKTGGKQVPLPLKDIPKLPLDLWVEGIQPSEKARDVELMLKSDDPHCEVRKLFTVEAPELDMDGVPHEKRVNPGGFVCVNKDDDNKNDVPDKDDPTAKPGEEDDLVELTLKKDPNEGSVTFNVLYSGEGRVQVWEQPIDQPEANLKGRRAEGRQYKAEELQKFRWWVEGYTASNPARDVELQLWDDDSGCVSILKVTVVEVDLKVSMRDRSGGFVPVVTEEDKKKKKEFEKKEKRGAFVAVNTDDDDKNGVLDDKPQAVWGEDDLIRLDLDIAPKPAKGKVTLKGSAGSEKKVRLWADPNKATTMLDLVNGVTLNASQLSRTPLWLEGIAESTALRDIELTLRCDEPRPCEDKVKVTAVQMHLETDLNMDGTIDRADWPLERKPGAYIVVNNDDDDRNGKPDYLDDEVDGLAPALPAGARAEQDLKRFEITLPLPAALQNEGEVKLRRSDDKIAVYSAKEKGVGAARLLWSDPPGVAGGKAFDATEERNGLKTWDLSDATQHADFVAVREHLWVEGVRASAAERDTWLSVSYKPKDTAAEIEMNRIDITVVRFERIRAVIEPTPELPPRVPSNIPAKHTFDNATAGIAGIVYHLNENKADPAKNFDGKHALVLIRGGNEEVPLSVTHQPATVPLRWRVVRSRDDADALGTGVPTLDPLGGSAAKLGTDERGSFLVFCYVDANGNGKFDEGEPRSILPLVLVDAELRDKLSVIHNHIAVTAFAPFYRVGSGTGLGKGFAIAAPDDAAAYLAGNVDLTGGGRDGKRGLDKVFTGWIQDIPVSLDVAGNYQGGHRNSYVFALLPHPAVALLPPPAPPVCIYLPPAAAPTIIAAPILDTGRSPTGTGGGTATLGRSQFTPIAGAPVGQRFLVETVDSPGLVYWRNHPGFAAPNALLNFHFNLDFRAWLSVWTNVDGLFITPPAPPLPATAERTYSVVLEVNWALRGSWKVEAAGPVETGFFGSISAKMGDTPSFHPPARAKDRAVSVRAPGAIQNLCQDGTK